MRVRPSKGRLGKGQKGIRGHGADESATAQGCENEGGEREMAQGRCGVKERPILMCGDMVRATLREVDPKTQTRRVVVPQPALGPLSFIDGPPRWGQVVAGHAVGKSGFNSFDWWKCKYGQPGDRLWVRETWGICSALGDGRPEPGHMIYYAASGCSKDGTQAKEFPNWPVSRWRPSIHMPRWASRITLEITDIRVERVQDISLADIEAEGTPYSLDPAKRPVGSRTEQYAALWDSINSKRGYGWDVNPWVWVVAFRRVAP